MSFSATVTPGWSYITGDTATASNLNALGNPAVVIPDNQLYVINAGTLAQPGISINGNANTGWGQLAGADTLSGVAGGTEVMRLTSTQVGFVNGTAASPSITFIGDGNTGFNHDSGDEIEAVCGGSVVATFLTTGMNVVGNIEADSITVNGLSVKTGGLETATVSFATDFLGSSTSWGTTSTLVATGTVAAISPPGHGTGDTAGRGYVTHTVAAVSDRAVVTVPFSVQPPTGFTRLRVQAGTLSNGTNRYEVLAGVFGALTVSSSSGSGAWFQYVDTASAQWQTVTYNGTTRETQTTAITYTPGTDYLLEVKHTAASTFEFYINGTLVTTHSTVTFATTTSNFQYVGVIIEKLVGSSSSVVYTDSIECQSPISRT